LFEHELDEKLLQLLAAVVDAQLLERIHFEILETKYVQDANESVGIFNVGT
jgi:hypothetical protein